MFRHKSPNDPSTRSSGTNPSRGGGLSIHCRAEDLLHAYTLMLWFKPKPCFIKKNALRKSNGLHKTSQNALLHKNRVIHKTMFYTKTIFLHVLARPAQSVACRIAHSMAEHAEGG